MDRDHRWEWVAGQVGTVTVAIVNTAVNLESWKLIVLGLALPVLFTIAYWLARDPRD